MTSTKKKYRQGHRYNGRGRSGGYVYGKKKKTLGKMGHTKKKKSVHSKKSVSAGEKGRGNTVGVSHTHRAATNKESLLSEIRHLIAENKLRDSSDVLSRYDIQLKKIRFLIKKDIIQIKYANTILALLNNWKAKSVLVNDAASPRKRSEAHKAAETAWRTLMNKDGWSSFSDAINIEGERQPTLLRQKSDM